MNTAPDIREPRVLLTRDDGVIVAKYFVYLDDPDTGHFTGICARNEDGDQSFFTSKPNPTWSDVYELNIPENASYEEKEKAIAEATGWLYEEEFPWLQIDELGDPIPETDTSESISLWLNSEVDRFAGEFEEELVLSTFDRTATEHAPGFIILAALTPKEVQQLQMREGDLGGPASSVPCVRSSATLEQLNAVLERKGLPFLFVDDDGTMEDGSC